MQQWVKKGLDSISIVEPASQATAMLLGKKRKGVSQIGFFHTDAKASRGAYSRKNSPAAAAAASPPSTAKVKIR